MISNIVNTFKDLAEKHKLIKSFAYEQLGKAAGLGDEYLPQFFLEEPIYISGGTTTVGSMTATVNFDIITARQLTENQNVYITSQSAQSLCYSIALNIISKLRNMIKDEDVEGIQSIVDFSFYTLRRWYDNNCDGIRVTLVLRVDNELNFCDLDEHFDPEKEFEIDKYLDDFTTDDAEGCVLFNDKTKLPTFTL